MTTKRNRLLTVGFAMLSIATLINESSAVQAGSAIFTSIDFPNATATGGPARWLGIDPLGDVVGAYRTAADNIAHGFLLRGNEYTSFDHPSSTGGTFANAINPKGDIVGGYFAGAFGHSYLLRTGAFNSFDPPGATISFALGINAGGDIVGAYNTGSTSLTTGSRGYLLRNGEFTSIDIPGAIYTWAMGINSEGTIVGRYQSGDGRVHGYLLYQTSSLRWISQTVCSLSRELSARAAMLSERIKAPMANFTRSC